jgi:hypothetical protein
LCEGIDVNMSSERSPTEAADGIFETCFVSPAEMAPGRSAEVPLHAETAQLTVAIAIAPEPLRACKRFGDI